MAINAGVAIMKSVAVISSLMLSQFALGAKILTTEATLVARPPVPERFQYLRRHIWMIRSQR